jgi:hypothetical protein
MTKAAVIIGALLLLAGVATAGTLSGLSSSDDSPTVTIPDDSVSVEDATISTGTVEDRTTSVETGEDISGPCDEAEHANDPRCTGVGQARDGRRGRGRDDRREDIRGPCDEAEHANDPRCTGVGQARDDRRGPGRDDRRGRDHDRREDRSGPSENSGPGSVDSGRGRDHDGDRGGNSGPGGGSDD